VAAELGDGGRDHLVVSIDGSPLALKRRMDHGFGSVRSIGALFVGAAPTLARLGIAAPDWLAVLYCGE
jgi:hypothetical protein